MVGSNAREAPSPTASTLFLPVGRLSRRGSRSSLSIPVDRATLTEALNDIHNVASQSQTLTVFNEFSAPPTAPPDVENKSLSADIQGGLSGLYSRLISSVGVGKDAAQHENRSADDGHSRNASNASRGLSPNGKPRRIDPPSSGPTSTANSRVTSPMVASFEVPNIDTRGRPVTVASKPTSIVSKASIAHTSGVRSPTAPLQKSFPHLTADPTVAEVNVTAVKEPAVRSRTPSIETDHYAGDVKSRAEQIEEAADPPGPLHPNGVSTPDFPQHQMLSPSLLATGAREIRTNRKAGHERVQSEQLAIPLASYSLKSTLADQIDGGSDLSSRSDYSSPAISASASIPSHPILSRMQTDTTDHSGRASVSGRTESKTSKSSQKIIVKTESKSNPSLLPGFELSRASSDSTFTAPSTEPVASSSSHAQTPYDRIAKPTTSTQLGAKLKSKLLSREFWMRDENARDCFRCNEPFSTFRRKHHCRTCGQIFDGKCTVLISGIQFGSGSSVRVCKPCERLINTHDDDSSDYSVEDLSLPSPASMRPQSSLSLRNPPSNSNVDDDATSVMSFSLEQMAKTPTMRLPLRGAAGHQARGSSVLEFEGPDRPLPRPSSSRSLKTSHFAGHKRHHSRHQHIRNFKAYHEDRAPFQRRNFEESPRDSKQSAFHRDSIIDPDLAQYLSDDASSPDENQDLFSIADSKLSKSVPESEKPSLSGLLAAVRKGRSRLADRSVAPLLAPSRDADEISGSGAKAIGTPKFSRRRNLSVASSLNQRGSPRQTNDDNTSVVTAQHEISGPSGSAIHALTLTMSKMTRSASMRGAGAPALELNRASLQHVRKLLQQLLQDASVSHVSSWQTALVPILLKATDDVEPDVQRGDDIDVRHYVKLKKIAGGKPGDTSYVSGLVFTKNLALKSMPRIMSRPRIYIISFAVEYARPEQHFMSLEPVIRQEKEYLQNMVGRIAALKPDLLLVQKNVSGLALQLLERAKIATAYNLKPTVLEAVSRCTQTKIISTIDKLAVKPPQAGTCERVEIRTYVSQGRKKTYMCLTGCPPSLGCTISLRGADDAVLSKIKRITEFMVYVVYNLKLETCLMRDEFALIPTLDSQDVKDPQSTNGVPTSLSTKMHDVQERLSRGSGELERTENTKSDAAQKQTQTKTLHVTQLERTESTEVPDSVPVPTFYEDLVQKHQTKVLSASPFVKFAQPYLLMRARELERRVVHLRNLRDQDISTTQSPEEKAKAQKFTLIQPEMVHASLPDAGAKVREILHAVHDSEYDKALHNYETQKKQWEAYLSGNKNLFDPYAHQNIVVLFSQVATSTSVPCSGPDLLAFAFYNEHETSEEFEADCTLGQYVEDICYRAKEKCSSETCELKTFEHHRQYVHGEAQISVFIQPCPSKMRGMQDTILMWSQCRICGNETPVIPMSSSTWKYSFGKYLELSFWSADLHARAGICPHHLHRDHLRHFGFKDFALRVQYDAISLLEIIVPRMRVTWKVDNDLRFRNEVYSKVERRLNRFMLSVKTRLRSINIEAVAPEISEACRAEVDRLMKKAVDEHVSLMKALQDRYSNSAHWETIPLNQSVRALQIKVAEWDGAFAEFEKDFFPSEKDIRRLATLQLKKIFLDRDVSVTSLASNEEGPATPPSEPSTDEKSDSKQGPIERPKQMTHLSLEKTQSVLQAVVEEHSTPDRLESSTESMPEGQLGARAEAKDEQKADENIQVKPDVHHLDLAVSTQNVVPNQEPEKSETAPSDMFNDLKELKQAVSAGMNTTRSIPKLEIEHSDSGARPGQLIDVPSIPILARRHESATRNIKELVMPSPPLLRAHSQPVSHQERVEKMTSGDGSLAAMQVTLANKALIDTTADHASISEESQVKQGEKKLSDRLGLRHLKSSKMRGHSLIPRSVSHRKDSRVSNLAKHFEQLSREFEKERVRERRLRAAENRHSRIYPLPSSKPIVEVYKDVDAAVEEKPSSDEPFEHGDSDIQGLQESSETAEGMAEAEGQGRSGREFLVDDTAVESIDDDVEGNETSRPPSEAEDEYDHTDDEHGIEETSVPDSPEEVARLSQEDLDLKELPKHERGTLMKMLTAFWAERSSSGWASLEYPLNAADHVFADCDIIVREDEPSSIIAFALDSQDYKTKLADIRSHPLKFDGKTNANLPDGPGVESQANINHSLLRKTGTHLKYQFQEGPARMLCKIFYAEQFDAVRRACGCAPRIVESLSRCAKWDSKGGKTKSLFLKTLDDRFVLKSLSPIETTAFLKFAPDYFDIMSETFFHEMPSVIAKMLGFFQILVRNPVTGIEYNWNLLVMENLFYDRIPMRIFDLKGSMRNRKIQSTGERNEVLLDENMVEFIYESPLFAREHSKKLLRSSVHNDTLFLARQNVMDYSLMMAIDENRKELVVGIIDCIRTYTWDKKLETWIKDRGFGGGGKNRPTVTSPKEYKKRFREAMGRYVLEAPT